MQDTNETRRQENLLKIEKRLHLYVHQHKDKFDRIAYTKAALNHLETHDSLELLDVSEFVNKENDKNNKDDENNSIRNNEGQSFHIVENNGKLVAVGHDGTILDGKNFEEINDKICQQYVKDAKAEGTECIVCYNGKDQEELKIFSKNAIMKYGITIGEGYPNDPEFWQNLKKEYLNDDTHSLQDWERMTRLIPDNVMQRTDEEKKRNQNLIDEMAIKKTRNTDAKLKKQLRNGYNPKLEAPAPRPKNNSHQKQTVLPKKRGRVME